MRAKTKKPKFNYFFGILGGILLLQSLMFLILMSFGIMKSLQPEDDFILQGTRASSIPKSLTLSNFIRVFDKIKYKLNPKYGGYTIYLEEMLFNSVIFSFGSAIVDVVVSTLMAYLTTKYDLRFNRVINFIVLFTLLVPIVGTPGSTIRIMSALNLRDTWIGVFILHAHFLGGNYLILQATFRSLSKEYGDAATIDGAGRLTIMLQIDWALVKPTLGIIFILRLIAYWNNYQTPMLYIPSHVTAAYGLFHFNRANSSEFDYIIYKVAGMMLILAPVFIVFMCFKNKMIGNLTMGGLKG